MLTNYYPIPIAQKQHQASLWRQLQRRIKLFTQGASQGSPLDKPDAENLHHIHHWQDTFNHLLANTDARLVSHTHSITITQTGKLGKLRHVGDMGLLSDGDIQACLYTKKWRQVWQTPNNAHIQLNCIDDSHQESWQLHSQEQCNTQLTPLSFLNTVQLNTAPAKPKPTVNTEELMQMWASLRHIHQFYDMLSLFDLNLLDSIHIMQDRWTNPITSQQLLDLIQACVKAQVNSKILSGNRGILHVLTSPIQHASQQQQLLDIVSDQYSCQLNLTYIKEVWLVKRATKQGIHHSIEAFDQHGRLILQIQENLTSQQGESDLWQRCLGRAGIIPMP